VKKAVAKLIDILAFRAARRRVLQELIQSGPELARSRIHNNLYMSHQINALIPRLRRTMKGGYKNASAKDRAELKETFREAIAAAGNECDAMHASIVGKR